MLFTLSPSQKSKYFTFSQGSNLFIELMRRNLLNKQTQIFLLLGKKCSGKTLAQYYLYAHKIIYKYNRITKNSSLVPYKVIEQAVNITTRIPNINYYPKIKQYQGRQIILIDLPDVNELQDNQQDNWHYFIYRILKQFTKINFLLIIEHDTLQSSQQIIESVQCITNIFKFSDQQSAQRNSLIQRIINSTQIIINKFDTNGQQPSQIFNQTIQILQQRVRQQIQAQFQIEAFILTHLIEDNKIHCIYRSQVIESYQRQLIGQIVKLSTSEDHELFRKHIKVIQIKHMQVYLSNMQQTISHGIKLLRCCFKPNISPSQILKIVNNQIKDTLTINQQNQHQQQQVFKTQQVKYNKNVKHFLKSLIKLISSSIINVIDEQISPQNHLQKNVFYNKWKQFHAYVNVLHCETAALFISFQKQNNDFSQNSLLQSFWNLHQIQQLILYICINLSQVLVYVDMLIQTKITQNQLLAYKLSKQFHTIFTKQFQDFKFTEKQKKSPRKRKQIKKKVVKKNRIENKIQLILPTFLDLKQEFSNLSSCNNDKIQHLTKIFKLPTKSFKLYLLLDQLIPQLQQKNYPISKNMIKQIIEILEKYKIYTTQYVMLCFIISERGKIEDFFHNYILDLQNIRLYLQNNQSNLQDNQLNLQDNHLDSQNYNLDSQNDHLGTQNNQLHLQKNKSNSLNNQLHLQKNQQNTQIIKLRSNFNIDSQKNQQKNSFIVDLQIIKQIHTILRGKLQYQTIYRFINNLINKLTEKQKILTNNQQILTKDQQKLTKNQQTLTKKQQILTSKSQQQNKNPQSFYNYSNIYEYCIDKLIIQFRRQNNQHKIQKQNNQHLRQEDFYYKLVEICKRKEIQFKRST